LKAQASWQSAATITRSSTIPKEKGRPVSRTAKKRNLWHPANIFAYIHSAAGKLILAANSVDPVHLRFGLSRAEV
jgi:hypothetical protein